MFRTCRQVACEMFISEAFQRPCRKKLYIQLNLSQTVHSNSKMLFLKQLIVFQSFCGALLTFSHFLLQGKVLCFARVGTSLSRCLFLKRSEDLVDKIISPVLLDTNRSFKW